MKTDIARRNVIGAFADPGAAQAAVRFLEHAGFKADDIAVVGAGNVRQAREVTGSRSIPGAMIGAALGLALFAILIIAGGPAMRENGVALVLGLAGFVGAGFVIGTLAGRSRVFVAGRATKYEDAVEGGETLVEVHVPEEERERATRLLREAGAKTVREEKTIESA